MFVSLTSNPRVYVVALEVPSGGVSRFILSKLLWPNLKNVAFIFWPGIFTRDLFDK